MRFKAWLLGEYSGGTAAASMLDGGRTDLPAARVNDNLPVQSKLSTKDGSDKIPPDGYAGKTPPDQLFRFAAANRNAARERRARWIDKGRRAAGFASVPPDSM